MSDLETPGSRLHATRVGMGITQQAMATAIKINVAQISRHESGKVGVSRQTAFRYANFLGVDVDFLLCRDLHPDLPMEQRPLPADAPGATPGQRLRALRISRGFHTLTVCARLIGVNPITMQHHEMDRREITQRRAAVYAGFFRVEPAFILFGGRLRPPATVDIVGSIEAGGQVNPMPTQGNDVIQVPMPAGVELNLVAYVVRGEGLYPAYFHGDVVLTPRPNGHVDPAEINNRECIVKTASGDRLIRVVKAEANGRYTIFGWHAQPQMHIKLREASPVVQINRGQLRHMPVPKAT
jgi:DNA-binding XRE family transcriptional regulator